ncbi:MAG: hypothetical protein GC161_12440 [Planctomycetaceae bacterium]|nr:hypothetical protein [Planctomycetaceae bacterium]
MSDPSPRPQALRHLEQRLGRWQRRALWAGFVGELGLALAVALALSALLALFLRSVHGVPIVELRWLALLLPAALGVALWRARGSRPTREQAAAALDLASGGRGLVLAALEQGDGRWGERAASEARTAGQPEQSFGGPRWVAALGAALFALLALAVPVDAESDRADHLPRLVSFAERLAERLEGLDEEGLLDERTAAALGARLASVREGLGDVALEAAVEALDRLDKDLGAFAEDLREQLGASLETLDGRLLDLARAALEGADPEVLQGAADALSEAMAKLAEGGARGATPELTQRALELSKRLAEEGSFADLTSALQLSDEARAALEKRLERLAERGLLPDGKLGEQLLGNKTSSALAREAFSQLAKSLASMESETKPHLCDACAAAAAAAAEGSKPCDGTCGAPHDQPCETGCAAAKPCMGGACSGGMSLGGIAAAAGRGGVSRGPGSAPLTFDGEARSLSPDFAPAPLGSVGVDDPEHELERFRVEAEVEAVGQAVGGDGVQGGAGDGRGLRRLSPRHRAALEAFQGRTDAPKGPR